MCSRADKRLIEKEIEGLKSRLFEKGLKLQQFNRSPLGSRPISRDRLNCSNRVEQAERLIENQFFKKNEIDAN